VSYDNNVIYYKYVEIEAAAAKPKISFLSNFPLRGGGGMGGAANKNGRKFLDFAPRELVESGRGASVIRQNPADFARNTFELRPIHTAANTGVVIYLQCVFDFISEQASKTDIFGF